MGEPSLFEATRLGLAKLVAPGTTGASGLQQAARASARALNVARVGIWLFVRGEEALRCSCQYLLDTDSFGITNPEIDLSRMPRYRQALVSRRVVLAHDAQHDNDTSELTESYLEPQGITSLLDAPIYRFGEVVGVVCHEHTGEPRVWTTRERDLAGSVSDVIAVLLEQEARIQVETAFHREQRRAAGLEKTASLTRFSAGIAHDFNNLLATMLISLQDLERRVAEPFREDVGEIIQVARSGVGIVGQLLDYARKGPHCPETLDLGEFVAQRATLLRATAGDLHPLVVEVAEGALLARVDPSRLEQLLLNLLTNARQAMPTGGEIGLAVWGEEASVVLRVSDQGAGIEDALKERIFEPFFTTKGTGSGIGLCTVQSVVTQHGGTLEVQTAMGEGAAFVARFPRVIAASPADTARTSR